jgi:hypothetical protein
VFLGLRSGQLLPGFPTKIVDTFHITHMRATYLNYSASRGLITIVISGKYMKVMKFLRCNFLYSVVISCLYVQIITSTPCPQTPNMRTSASQKRIRHGVLLMQFGDVWMSSLPCFLQNFSRQQNRNETNTVGRLSSACSGSR